MSQQCRLQLDNYSGQYMAGSSIQGRIILHLDSDITLRGVRVTLLCKEHTEWIGSESHFDNGAKEQRSRDTQFTGDKEVLSVTQWLYGDQHGTTNLPAGQHIYPFVVTLQQNIPGTYQCERGSISYKLIATVDRPMAFDYEDQLFVVVNSPVDLHFFARPEDLQASSYSDEKTVCCWCCAQGPITMDVELPKKTLIPGEQIQIKMHLTNMSNTNVEGVSLELKQVISYKAHDPNRDDRQDTNIIADLKDVGLGAHGENTYLFNVTLPLNVVLPNFAQCALFSVEYIYKAIAHLPSMHNNLEVLMRPKVGHIPIGNSNSPAGASGAGALYPSFGWTGGPNPSAPPFSSKESEANPYPGYNSQQSPDNLPPSYESLMK